MFGGLVVRRRQFLLHVLQPVQVDRHSGGVVRRLHLTRVRLVVVVVGAHAGCLTLKLVPATPIPRPTWLKVTAALAILGVVAWPVLAMLGLLGAVPADTVVNVGLVTAALAYIAIRRIKRDRVLAAGPPGEPGPPAETPSPE